MAKREAEEYTVEKTVDTVKVLEALEGKRFEPVTIAQIIERVGKITGRKEGKETLKFNAVRDILITLELLGWVTKIDKSTYTIGQKAVRFTQKIFDTQI